MKNIFCTIVLSSLIFFTTTTAEGRKISHPLYKETVTRTKQVQPTQEQEEALNLKIQARLLEKLFDSLSENDLDTARRAFRNYLMVNKIPTSIKIPRELIISMDRAHKVYKTSSSENLIEQLTLYLQKELNYIFCEQKQNYEFELCKS